jgi:hypothetical protein
MNSTVRRTGQANIDQHVRRKVDGRLLKAGLTALSDLTRGSAPTNLFIDVEQASRH